MQPVRAPLPELDLGRKATISAPVRRARWSIAIALAHVLHGRFQHFPRGHRLALRARPGREPRAERAALVIGVRVGSTHALDRAVDANLTLEGRPQEHEAGRAFRLELPGLAAAVIRIEDEAAAFDAFQQHHPCTWLACGADGGERHRVDERQFRTQRILEPTLELPHRIAIHLGFREPGSHVFLPQIRDVHGGILRCETQRPREIRPFSL